jgi:HEAT repeat protein
MKSVPATRGRSRLLALALAACTLAGCGRGGRVVRGTTFLDGQPRGLVEKEGDAGDDGIGRSRAAFLGRRPRGMRAVESGAPTFLGRRPRGFTVHGSPPEGGASGHGASVAGALASGSVGGKSLDSPATVSSVSDDTSFEAPVRPAPASMEEARARALSDLASRSTHYRYEGAIAAAAYRIEEAVPLLARLARGAEASAAPAIGALGIIGGEEAARGLANALSRQRETYVRIRIIRALGVTRAKRALKPLLGAFADDRALVRIEAARALGRLGDSGAAPRLRAALAERGAVTAVKVAAASSLALLGDTGGIGALESALSSRSPELGAVAVRGLAAMAAGPRVSGAVELERTRARAVQAIAAALGSPYAGVWGEALRALARLRPVGALRVLDALENAAPEVRVRARVAKAAFGGSGAREVLEGALTHPAFELRAAAAEILGLLGDRAAVDALARTLGDPRSSVRVSAARALGNLRDPAATAALKRARARDDAALRRTCDWALAAIGRRRARATEGSAGASETATRPDGGYELQRIVAGAGGRRFCVVREPGGAVVLLGTGEETADGHRVERIVPSERGGGTVFLSRGEEALTLRSAPGPAKSVKRAAP